MIEHAVSFDLPVPWISKKFEIERFGAVNFLVGPNGSGKSRFAEILKARLPKSRLLGTERLRGMERHEGMGFLGENFQGGYQKNWFDRLKTAGRNLGFGIDSVVILEERLDLRVKVEATLSQLFNRRIILEWDSGNLIPKAVIGKSGSVYRLDSEECHGIKELLVLLTHLYNDDYQFLIIDEPELHLHPQFQAFFMQEVRKVAGDPNVDPTKKVIFLITHSPFILDLCSVDDLKSIISFDLNHSVPQQMFDIDAAAATRLSTLVPRLNVHHKQLFFSDNPIFVEGILDSQIVQMIQECRGASVAGAGSCVIDAGGCDEVNKYLALCEKFGKQAWFLYDLDSLFTGNLRACVRDDDTLANFLATLGLGSDFGRYCGELDRKLTELIKAIRNHEAPPNKLTSLRDFLISLGEYDAWDKLAWGRARVAVLVQISFDRQTVIDATSSESITEIEGRLDQITSALRLKNILLLRGGALEHHLPSYQGDRFNLTDAAKKNAVDAEVSILAGGLTHQEMGLRYGALYRAICDLPARPPVEADRVLIDYLSNYIHELQGLVIREPSWGVDQLQTHLNRSVGGIERIFSLENFSRGDDNQFSATIAITGMLGEGDRIVEISHKTNAGMRDFRMVHR